MSKLIEDIDQNLGLHSSKIPAAVAGMKVQNRAHLTFVDCGLPCDTFNIIHITKGKSLPIEELQESISYYTHKGSVFCIWINETQFTGNSRQLFNQLNLQQMNVETGMAMDLISYIPPSIHESLPIKIASTPQEIADFAAVVAQNWQPPDTNVITFYQEVTQEILSASDDIMMAIYYHKNQPISVIELFASDEKTVGIYNLSTLPSYRGKGIGTAMMHFALQQAKNKGYKTVILQASANGLPIYTRLGFTALTSYYEYH